MKKHGYERGPSRLYEDIVTGMELLSACMPVHHDDTLQSELYGVVRRCGLPPENPCRS